MGKSGKDFSPNSIRNINDDWGNDSRNNLPYSGQAVQTFLKNLLTSLSNYANLTGKPKVNNVELSGNKSLADLGITYSAIKPATGVPKSDLASDVQASLGKADTALQSVPNTYRTASDQDVIDATKQPKTDNTLSTTSKQVAGAINELKPIVDLNTSKADTILGAIPSQTWMSGNQLADKAFVNSSVQTATANFRGNWSNWAAVPTASSLYPADYTGSKTPTTNDYLVVVDMLTYFKTADEIKQLFPPSTYFFPNGTCCTYNGYVWKSADTGFINVYPSVDSALWTRLFAEADIVDSIYALAIVVNGKVYPYDGKLWAAHDVPAGSAWSAYNPATHPECFTEKPHQYEGTWRFKYTGNWDVNGKAGWQTEYQVNEKPLTAAQLAALNSGITQIKTALIPTLAEWTAWNGKYTKPANGIPATDMASAVQTSLGKADTALQSQEQADWNETDTTDPAYIKNKPTIPTLPTIATGINAQSTNTEVAGAKAVYDYHDTSKQDKLIAGQGISIAADGKTISATTSGGGNASITFNGDGSADITNGTTTEKFLPQSAVAKWGVMSQTQTWTRAADLGYDYAMSNLQYGWIPQSFINDFLTYCKGYGAFNQQTGYFELNGLTDISYEEARIIKMVDYCSNANSYAVYDFACIRDGYEEDMITVVPRTILYRSNFGTDGSPLGVAGGSKVETMVFYVHPSWIGHTRGYYIQQTPRIIFTNFMYVKTIKTFSAVYRTSLDFTGAYSLETLLLSDIKVNVNLKDSSRLTAASVAFMIKYAQATPNIVITLHATAYARAIADTEVQTQLATHTNVTLAQAS